MKREIINHRRLLGRLDRCQSKWSPKTVPSACLSADFHRLLIYKRQLHQLLITNRMWHQVKHLRNICLQEALHGLLQTGNILSHPMKRRYLWTSRNTLQVDREPVKESKISSPRFENLCPNVWLGSSSAPSARQSASYQTPSAHCLVEAHRMTDKGWCLGQFWNLNGHFLHPIWHYSSFSGASQLQVYLSSKHDRFVCNRHRIDVARLRVTMVDSMRCSAMKWIRRTSFTSPTISLPACSTASSTFRSSRL